jgi:hypothetical protein
MIREISSCAIGWIGKNQTDVDSFCRPTIVGPFLDQRTTAFFWNKSKGEAETLLRDKSNVSWNHVEERRKVG